MPAACPDLNSGPNAPHRTLLLLQLSVLAQKVLIPSVGATDTMQLSLQHTMNARSNQTVIHELRELVAALDRRVPRIERDGERAIARDAEALRRAALERIGELERLLGAQ